MSEYFWQYSVWSIPAIRERETWFYTRKGLDSIITISSKTNTHYMCFYYKVSFCRWSSPSVQPNKPWGGINKSVNVHKRKTESLKNLISSSVIIYGKSIIWVCFLRWDTVLWVRSFKSLPGWDSEESQTGFTKLFAFAFTCINSSSKLQITLMKCIHYFVTVSIHLFLFKCESENPIKTYLLAGVYHPSAQRLHL